MLTSDAQVLDSWSLLCSNGRRMSVSASPEGVSRLAAKLKAQGKHIQHWDMPYLHPSDDMIFATHVLPACLMDFHLWLPDSPDEKFTVKNSYEEPDHFYGSFAKDYCFWRAFSGVPVKGSDLKMQFKTMHATESFFRGTNRIPHIEERFWMMQEYIEVLDGRFGGEPLNIYEEAKWDACHLVELLVAAFPKGFGGDVATLRVPRSTFERQSLGEFFFTDDGLGPDLVFPFYKRAKLVALAYQGRALKKGSRLKPLAHVNQIIAVPDDQVPRFLQHEGVLVYSEELLEKIKNRELIRSGSQFEVEIRAGATGANFSILCELNKDIDSRAHPDYWDIMALDPAEWFGGKDVPFPRHLTPGTNY